VSKNVTTQEGGNALDEERTTDLISAFGNQMGTFTGTWRVYLRDAESEYAKQVIEHFAVAEEDAPTNVATRMYFTMTKLEVGRSASRCTISGPSPLGWTSFVSLEKQNTVEWWFAEEQHMISPF
jgi:hypothetical protein